MQLYIWPVTSHDCMQAADKDRSGALDLTEFVSMFDKLFGWTGNVKVHNILLQSHLQNHVHDMHCNHSV